MKVRTLAVASVLFFFGAMAGAQSLSLRLGGVLGTEELATWAKNNFDEQKRQIEQLRRDTSRLAEAVDGLTKALERERNQTAEDARNTSSLLASFRAQAQAQAQELLQQVKTEERLRQELAKQMEGRVSDIATQVLQQLGRTRDELAKLSGESAELRGEIKSQGGIVAGLQTDRTDFDRRLFSLLADQKNLQNALTRLESRKTELDDLRSALGALQVSSKADLENVKRESGSVDAEMDRRVDKLTETLRETQAAGEKAKLDFERQLRETREAQDKAKLEFERQLREMREEFRSGVGAIRKEVDTQVTDTKKEVTEIRRSTAPVTVEIDGRPFEALPADRDSYQAAISRVMNAPKAKTPREEYEAARADVQKFMDSVANPGFRGSSFFWLGMAQAGAGQCREALVSFEEMRKLVDTVRHPRYPTAMLQKATCQLMLKEPQDRINRSVKELMDQFPGTPEAESAKALLPPPRKNR